MELEVSGTDCAPKWHDDCLVITKTGAYGSVLAWGCGWNPVQALSRAVHAMELKKMPDSFHVEIRRR